MLFVKRKFIVHSAQCYLALASVLTLVLAMTMPSTSVAETTAAQPDTQLHAASEQAGPIRVGLTVSRSGALAQFGVLVERGLKLWQQDVNARGNLLGREIELVIYDDKSNTAEAAARYQQLLDEGVDLLVSPYSTPMTIATRELIRTADVAMVSIASAPEIWDQAEPRIFGLYTPADHNMDPFLDLMVHRGLKRVAIAYQNSAFPQAVAQGVRAQATKRGLDLVFEEAYSPDAAQSVTDFARIIERMKSTQPQGIVVAGYLEDSIAFSKAAHRTGLVTDLIAFSGGPALRAYGNELPPNQAQGALSTVQWMRSVRMPGSFDFGFRYRNQHGTYPSYDAAGGYAAGQVLEAAIRLADSSDPGLVRTQLKTMKYRSILGHYRVDDRGQQTAKQTYLVQWQDNHISLVYPTHLARWDLLYPLPWNRDSKTTPLEAPP